MATRASIEMDFRQAMAQADRVDDAANNLSGVSNRQLEGTLQDLASGWNGENADAYLAKGAKLQSRINNSASELQEIASTIRRIAKRIYDTEMANLRIAEQRDY